MTITNHLMKRFAKDVTNLQEGLHPESLAFWYAKIIQEAKDMAPPWLAEKISVHQDPLLPMKFNLDISKRAVRYFMMAVDNNLSAMPNSTKMYFLKVEETLSGEMDKSLV
ncbi:MAG TPA: hypothetical protein VLF17_01450 [Candidatus Nitrosotenuis sp.]|nr:hypothetical protein [Candidatus Nitrosotenuis sp.]